MLTHRSLHNLQDEASTSRSSSLSRPVVDEKVLFDTRLEIVRNHLDQMAPPMNMKRPQIQRKPTLFQKVQWDNIVEDYNSSP